MPRFRFNWANVPGSILVALSQHLSLQGDPIGALRKRFGARPKEEFVGDCWTILLHDWLAHDVDACGSIAATLRERGVGSLEINDNHEYLRSCRNTSGLRRVVLPEFITIGETPKDVMGVPPQPVDAATPPFGGRNRLVGPESDLRPEGGVSPGDEPATPRSPKETSSGQDEPKNPVEHLRGWIGPVLREVTGEVSIGPDAEGDFAIPYGSTVLFVSVHDEPLRIEIFAPLIVEVDSSAELLKTINIVNGRLHLQKVTYVDQSRAVIMSAQVPALSLSTNSVNLYLNSLAQAADFFDTQLQDQFGGQLVGQDQRNDEQIV